MPRSRTARKSRPESGGELTLRPRQLATVALILGLTLAGFVVARLIIERDARADSELRAGVAAAQIRGRIGQAASLTESLRRFMLDRSGTGITSDQFARNALRWLSSAGFPAAAWVERVPDSRRAAYERRLGQPIVTPDQGRSVLPPGKRSAYLPATLVSGFHPMALPGTDLSGEPGMGAALARATRIDGVAATPVAAPRRGTNGLFLVAPVAALVDEDLHPGYVAVFVSKPTLRAAATDAPGLQILDPRASTEAGDRANTASQTFTAAGQRFEVVVPQESVEGAAAALPWIVLAAGLVLSALAAALGVSAARRSSAQDELDRIFTLSSDLIAVADFNGYFTRVNPAGERILGYTEEELVARPYLDFVHPDDREQTATEAAAPGDGTATFGFENRYVRKDGSHRVLEWTATPVPDEGLVYCVARDVTERREAEAEVERLADTQAALRRVATLVARGGPAAEVFEAVAHEAGELLGVDAMHMGRYEANAVVSVAGWSRSGDHVWPGMRVELDGSIASLVFRSGRPARIDGPSAATGTTAEQLRNKMGVQSAVAVPIVVEGRLWGLMVASSKQSEPLPADTESRLLGFTELAETAIVRAEAQAELGASRARLVAAADDERRRVVRDLHDGAQQRLVQTVIMLKLAGAELQDADGRASELVSDALGHAEAATADLRELSHGILPAVLAHGGLGAGADALAARMTVPVEVDVAVGRLPKSVEATAYFLVAEALTNVAKHARAHRAIVTASVSDDALQVEVRDDGVGGARIEGSGLVGLRDRVTALKGSFDIDSPPGEGTVVTATIPVDAQP